MREYKLVVLGAGGVGKSALTVQYVQGVYVESYDPTIEDSYRKLATVDGRSCTLEILDTAGVEQFTAMRELYIKNGEGFVLVYSVTSEESLQELMELREQVVRIKDNANVPLVLVANKCDLQEERQVSSDKGVEVADSWGRVPFYETSAKYRSNVDEVFVDLVRQIMRRDSAFGSTLGFAHASHASVESANAKGGSRMSRVSSGGAGDQAAPVAQANSHPHSVLPAGILDKKSRRKGGRKVSGSSRKSGSGEKDDKCVVM